MNEKSLVRAILRLILPYIFLPFCISHVNGQLIGNYTIDPGLPAGPTNYTSFGAALSALHAIGIGGDVSFVVAAGTYTEQVVINTITGASSSNQVTFKSASGNATDVILQYSASLSTANYTLFLDGGSHCTFSDITIRSLGNTYGRVIELKNDASYNEFLNCHIEGYDMGGGLNNFVNIYCKQGSGTSPTGNIFRGNIIRYGSWGIHMRSDATATDIKGTIIENNQFLDQTWIGIYFFSTEGNTIHNNRISSTANIGTGIWIGGSNTSEPWSIERNLIDLERSGGTVTGMDLSLGSSSQGAIIANNMILVGNTGPGYARGIEYAYNRNAYYFYNTIWVEQGIASQSFAITDVTPSASSNSNLQFVNNIFSNATGGLIWDFRDDPTGNFLQINYNIYHNVGGADFADWGGTPVPDLASFRSQTGQDVQSIFRDPDLILEDGVPIVDGNTNDLADFQATPVSVGNDYYGNTRDAVAPFKGASEYHSMDAFFPVEWLYARAEEVETGVHITWATAQEHNNDLFIVQRSFNGQDWQHVGEIISLGNSRSIQEYQWLDMDVGPQKRYYKILQQDFDGTQSSSPIVEIFVEENQTSFLLYPNPAKEKMYIQIPQNTSSLHVFDLQGRTLFKQIHPLPRTFILARKNLKAGMYIVEIQVDGSVLRQRFLFN